MFATLTQEINKMQCEPKQLHYKLLRLRLQTKNEAQHQNLTKQSVLLSPRSADHANCWNSCSIFQQQSWAWPSTLPVCSTSIGLIMLPESFSLNYRRSFLYCRLQVFFDQICPISKEQIVHTISAGDRINFIFGQNRLYFWVSILSNTQQQDQKCELSYCMA